MTDGGRRKSAAELEHERLNGVAWAAFGEARAKATRLTGDASVVAHQAARDALTEAYRIARVACCAQAESCQLCGRPAWDER